VRTECGQHSRGSAWIAGGRVELFHLGVINGLVYYLDFTSLYPAMGFKHEMPYGAPEWWSTFDPPSPDEVMGFGKHANKTRAEVIETDQNYCQWALCQRNPHVGLKVFTRLLRHFSFGHPVFAWNDYEAMHHPTDPKPLTCTQTQFKLGMSGYCRDGDGIKPITIHKIPKNAHARYDKGNLQSDGRIVPWLI